LRGSPAILLPEREIKLAAFGRLVLASYTVKRLCINSFSFWETAQTAYGCVVFCFHLQAVKNIMERNPNEAEHPA
jgi:hypothetical protein